MSRKSFAAAVSFLVFFALAGVVLAQPPPPPPPPPPPSSIPAAFYGTVEIGGGPALAGAAIEAKIEGELRGNVTVNITGEYGTQGPFDQTRLLVNGNDTDEGKTIDFFVNGRQTNETGIWHSGGITNLNLTVPPFCGDLSCNGGETCSSCTQDCGSCPAPPGGGGGAAGGGGAVCTALWRCSDWGECANGTQARDCSDINKCGTNASRPAESNVCGVPSKPAPQVCAVGTRVCADSQLLECMGDSWKVKESCPERCYQGECIKYGNQTVPGQAEGAPTTGLFLSNLVLWLYGLVIVVMAVIGAAAFRIWKRSGSA